MADILIRGMEMPKNCEDCRLSYSDEYGTTICAACDDCAYSVSCPLVPLPEGHGRQIYAERFRVILCRLKERQNDDVAIHALNWAIECLDKLDAIVPAEGGGE